MLTLYIVYQEGGIAEIMLYHQTVGPITGWAYKQESL